MTKLFDGDPRESKFRNSSGKLVTIQLFYELQNSQHQYTMYTLKDVDWRGYPSLHRLYLEMGDLTEYEFATTYFESWEHWQKVLNIPEVRALMSQYRQELELKTTAEILKNVRVEAAKGSFQANKILLDYAQRLRNSNGEKPLAETKRGRPSKQDVRNEVRNVAEEEHRLSKDLERLLSNDAITEPDEDDTSGS